MPAHCRTTKRKGFTLIELLVVIAILSLLVSILLPSLQKAKALAQRINCLTRQRNIGSACFLYQGDFHDRGPVGFSNGTNAPRPGWSLPDPNPYKMYFGWYSRKNKTVLADGEKPCWGLGEYLERKGANVNDEGGHTVSPVSCPSPAMLEEFGSHQAGYAVNSYLGYDTYLGDHVVAMASTPMIMEGIRYNPAGEGWTQFRYIAFPEDLPYSEGGWAFEPASVSFPGHAELMHEGTGNYLFFDGHAENQEALDDVEDYLDLWTWYGR